MCCRAAPAVRTAHGSSRSNGHSDTFTEFDGGDAWIAIHGTNDPSSIGAAVSSGCVRVAADPLTALAAGLPAGTPVVIR